MKMTDKLISVLAAGLTLVACNTQKERDFTAEIDDAMNSFSKLCEQTYADSTMCDSLRETFLNARYDSLCAVLSTITDEALAKHEGDSLAADIIMLQYNFELIDEKQALERFEALNEDVKERSDVKEMCVLLNNKVKTVEGVKFIDFEITQPDGSVARLSDYAGNGKYCLVDFWASWCGPCRGEIPYVRSAWEKYAEKGLTVLSVAVWDKAEDSRNAAVELGICWNQILDAQSVPTDIYGIAGIPHIMLIGPDGTILARGLRGDGIVEEIAKYL